MDLTTALLDIATNFGAISETMLIKVISSTHGARAEAMDGSISEGAIFAARTGGSSSESSPTALCYCELDQPIDDFKGIIGLRKPSLLKGYFAFPSEFKTEIITETRGAETVPVEIRFDYASGTKAWYRLTSAALTNELVQVPPFKWTTFELIHSPDAKSVKLLKHFAKEAAVTEKLCFWPSMNARGNLYLSFDVRKPTNSTARFLFGTKLAYAKLVPYSYPAKPVLKVLALASTSKSLTMSFSNKGALKIDVANEFFRYRFVFPGSDTLVWAWGMADDWPHVYGIEHMMRDDQVMHHEWTPD